MPRRRACTGPRTRPIRCSPTCSSSILRASSRRSPGPSARRIACCSRRWRRAFASAMDKEFSKAARVGQARAGRGPQARSRPRRRGYRRDHLLHQYVQPERHDRRRPAGAQCARKWPHVEAVGEDFARARLAGRRRISREVRPAEGPRRARLQSRRLRLHDLHRQFRTAAAGNLEDRSTTTISWPPPCSPATATSRAASTRTCAPTISPRRRWWSLMRSPASMQIDMNKTPLGIDKKGKKVFLKDIWPSSREIDVGHRASASPSRCSRKKYANVFKGDANWRKIARQGRPHLCVGPQIDLCAEPALFRRHMHRAPTPVRRHRRGAHARPVPRLDHDRPHLAGGLDQARFARPGNIWSITRSSRPTSISTARGAATTK